MTVNTYYPYLKDFLELTLQDFIGFAKQTDTEYFLTQERERSDHKII